MLLFALPMIAGNLLQQTYNIADTLIVGRYLGTNALGAVGTSFALMTFVTSVVLGLCMGSGALFAIQYGRGADTELKAGIFTSFVLCACVSAGATVICFLLTDSFRVLLQIPKEPWEIFRSYVLVVFCGIPAVFLYNFYGCLLRAFGNSVTPLIFLAVCAVLNVVLDLWFVVGLHLGAASAAAATVIAQWISGIGLMLYSELKMPVYGVRRNVHRIQWAGIREIAAFSGLTCIQQSVMNLGILMVQGLVNSFGVVTMAAFSAAVKIDAFAYMPVQDFGNAFSTFVAQNYGAAQTGRIRRGLASAGTVSVLFSALVSVLTRVLAEPLMGIFVEASEADVIRAGAEYLRVEGPFYFAIGLLFLLYGLYRAVGRPGISVVLTVVSLGTRVALAYMLSALPGVGTAGIWWSVPIGWILADTVGFGYLARHRGTLSDSGRGKHGAEGEQTRIQENR